MKITDLRKLANPLQRKVVMIIEWSDSLSIDHGSIDQDHRYIIHLIDLLYNFPENGQSFVGIDQLFCDLIDFMAVHL